MKHLAHPKINLTLHITGRRADGYHLLDSLMVFAANVADVLEVQPAPELRLTLDGSTSAGIPAGEDNLVMRAAKKLAAEGGVKQGANLHLTKHIPHGAGLGGGSADAAAVLQALNRVWGLEYSAEKLAALGLQLGADVPVCLAGNAMHVTGIGEHLAPVKLPELYAVLAHPCVAVDTRAVFRGDDGRSIPASAAPTSPQELAAALQNPEQCIAWLAGQHNALEPYAIRLAPVIGEVLAALRALPGCRLARMSGSGSACFALFMAGQEAEDAAAALKRTQPGWWVAATQLR